MQSIEELVKNYKAWDKIMKNILFYCNTHYQIIISLQIAKCFFRDDNVKLIVSDHSNNAKKYVENLKNVIGEDKVHFVKSKSFDYCKLNCTNFIFKIRQFVLKRFPLLNVEFVSFDKFIAYNANFSVEMLVRHLKNINPNIVISRMEEGILSYNNITKELQEHVGLIQSLKEYIKDKIGWYDIYKYEQNMYCTYPQLYKGKLNTIQIPLIDTSDKEFIEKISKVFGVDREKLAYPQKYIFFSSVLDFEGGKPVGELQMALKVAELVGKENLLVKVHPRDDVNRFIKVGLTVDKNSSVPWEAIQLNYDFSNHVFLTVCSGSVLSISSIILNPPTTYLLYKLINSSNSVFKDNVRKLEDSKDQLDEIGKFNYIKIPNDLAEIIQD